MSTARRRISFKDVGGETAKLLRQLAQATPKQIGKAVADMPRLFENEALRHYPSVLRVRTGFLRGSTAGLGRQSGNDTWETGLQNKMNYAGWLERGTKHITPRKFLEDPIRKVAAAQLSRMLGKIGW